MPGASLDTLRLRARLLAGARAWFADRGVLEVETPALSSAAATDPNLHSLAVRCGGAACYLHTSPEFPMKRLLAAGYGDIYQICRVFRDGEAGSRHNPEFTMLEWYRVGLDLQGMMAEVESLIAALCEGHRPFPPAERRTYRDLVSAAAGIDPLRAGAEELMRALAAAGVDAPAGTEQDRDALLDLLFVAVVEPAMNPGQPLFVTDFPATRAALARIRPGDPPVAERFELFLGGMELANGFHELTDAEEQRARFENDLARRAAAGGGLPPMDRRFLRALEAGLPDCSGVAVGIDRLLMCLTGAEDIRQVLAFDISRA